MNKDAVSNFEVDVEKRDAIVQAFKVCDMLSVYFKVWLKEVYGGRTHGMRMVSHIHGRCRSLHVNDSSREGCHGRRRVSPHWA